MTERNCTSRALTEHDVSSKGKICKPEVKIKQESTQATGDSEQKEKKKAKKAAEHRAAEAASPPLDLSKLDDVERVLFTGMRIFLDKNGDDEDAEATTTRFKLAAALVASTPHHEHKLRTLIRGDNHRHLQLVSINLRSNARQSFKALLALCEIKFGQEHKTIDDIINALHLARIKAEFTIPGAIGDSVLRGAIRSNLDYKRSV